MLITFYLFSHLLLLLACHIRESESTWQSISQHKVLIFNINKMQKDFLQRVKSKQKKIPRNLSTISCLHLLGDKKEFTPFLSFSLQRVTSLFVHFSIFSHLKLETEKRKKSILSSRQHFNRKTQKNPLK